MTFQTLWRVTGQDGRVLLESVWEPHVSAFLASRRGTSYVEELSR